MRDKIRRVARNELPATKSADQHADDVADAFIAALPDMIEPLVWAVSEIGYADDYHTIPTKYTIRWQDEDEYRVGWNGGFSFHNSAEAAKSAANAHHRAAIMAAFGVSL